MKSLSVFCALAGANLRSLMQHRASFAMASTRNLLASVADYARVFVLFGAFGTLGGWSAAEVAVLYGMVNAAYALAEGLGRGLDRFSRLIRQGDFDRVLLRPRSAVMQVAGAGLEPGRLGRLTVSVGVLALGNAALPTPLDAGDFALVAVCILGGTLLFLGLLLIRAAACFWTVQPLEAFNVLTYGGIATASYPLDIYSGWLRDLFLFVIPLGCLNYLPSAVLFDKALPYPPVTAYLAPAAGAVFLLLGLGAWALGVRRYRSTGS